MKKPKKASSLVQVTALVSPEEKARLEQKAKSHKTTVSHAARMAIVNRNKKNEL